MKYCILHKKNILLLIFKKFNGLPDLSGDDLLVVGPELRNELLHGPEVNKYSLYIINICLLRKQVDVIQMGV